MSRYNIKDGQKLFVVSQYSCGGYVYDSVVQVVNNNDLIIYDTTNTSEFTDDLKQKTHFHVSNDSLEEIFGKFSNIILVEKKKEKYQIRKINPT